MSCGTDEYKRFQMIDEYFSAGNKATIKELSEYLYYKNIISHKNISCGFSEKVLYKVLAAMKNELGAPIDSDSQNRYFYSSGKTLTKPGFLLREETGKTVKLIQNLLETVKNTPVYEKAEKLCNEILDESKKQNSSANSSRVIFLGAPASNVKDEIWSKIYEAMEKNYQIVIEYKSSESSGCTRQAVQPYQLIFDNGIWDLWGFAGKKMKRTIFNLSRIKSVEIRDDSPFNLPSDFDFHNMTPGTFGCFFDFDGEMTNYKIKFKKGSYAENFVSERVWGKNFQLTKDESGTILSFDDNQFLPILRWILGWGADAEPIEPENLVSAWKNEIKKMNEKTAAI